MRIDIITLFPSMFRGFLEESIIKRAQAKSLVEIHLHNIRDFTLDKHHKVDDRPYGGGPGMVLTPEPVFRTMEYLSQSNVGKDRQDVHRVLLTPRGKLFDQAKAKELAKKPGLVLLCGHYEGFDERVHQALGFEEISIGEYVLSGGEIPALVVMDAVIRLIPNVLGNPESAEDESFSQPGQVEFPQYTRPRDFRGLKVPEVLVSGNHKAIREWRQKYMLRVNSDPKNLREEYDSFGFNKES